MQSETNCTESQKRSSIQLHYQSILVLTALRENIAAYLYQARGLSCQPEQIIINNGSQLVIYLAAHWLLAPNAQEITAGIEVLAKILRYSGGA